MSSSIRVEDKLSVDRFHSDEHNCHIDVDKQYPDLDEINIVIKACPAGLYKLDEQNKLYFDYLGCLECGTCRVLSGGRLIRSWNYPLGGMGIEFRYG